MEKHYPYVTDNGRTLVLGKSVDAKEDEKLPPEEIENVRELKVYDVTNMTQEEFDAFLAPYMK